MKINKELMKGSTVILMMKQLEHRDMYGYEMAKRIEQQSDGLFAFKEGTLYPILHMLEVERLVEAYWGEENGRKRKYYKLTDAGRRTLVEKEREWSLFSTTVSRLIGEGRA
ncbi:PadR family transcriptional regulator [Paenibacillus sacheonensis]|uniref:PadR family transcriptional regulator n=1 Tax=Paenibacillus sacheonensis TaxID=742054 RepID=A0A7X4YVY9_9BACL|nr:helix-turn-helix transcriptional regulator [Paenibacillus sacheonensis]MBM7566637.1 DNA-binding PadR family transcriptional regulator [Paenibacillus sacheonensis]NBC73553.1 PadR family transcriptional regulator [Paenibacillus sacheonensis]